MSWPFHSPDSFNSGFWTGQPGSLDFCEENYVHSACIAETVNTLSNLSYIILALYGLWNCRVQRLPTRFFLCNLCLLCVGCGSAAYHATLRRFTQAYDEVPMIYTVGFITYTVFNITPHRWSYVLPAAFSVSACTWLTAYLQIETPTFHELSFAALGIFTSLRVLFLFRYAPRLQSNSPIARHVRTLYYQGFAVFVSGFVVWNLENWYCASLRAWRTNAGWPATWLAQGHAYWHVATAVGAYRMIVASELLFLIFTQRAVKYTVKGTLFPVVRRLSSKMR